MIEGEKYDNSHQKLCGVQYEVWSETALLSKQYNQSLSALIEWQQNSISPDFNFLKLIPPKLINELKWQSCMYMYINQLMPEWFY